MAKQVRDLLRQDDMLEQEVEAVLVLCSSAHGKIFFQYLKRLHNEALLICENPPTNINERQLGQIQGRSMLLRYLVSTLEQEARQLLDLGR